jgi:hypothetical protein
LREAVATSIEGKPRAALPSAAGAAKHEGCAIGSDDQATRGALLLVLATLGTVKRVAADEAGGDMRADTGEKRDQIGIGGAHLSAGWD